MVKKLKDIISSQDAMDNLAAIVSIDLDNLPPVGIVKKYSIVTTEEEFAPDTVQWLTGEGSESLLEILDLTYRSIHHYLIKMYENPETDWENKKSQNGIAAMMLLVGESAVKIESYLELRLGKPLETSVISRPEYKALQKFYSHQFLSKLGDQIIDVEKDDEDEASIDKDLSNNGLQDFEVVRSDSEYELFYIRNSDGQPYFDPALLRHIKLSCDFDINEHSFEEDPLLKIRAMKDRDLHATASQILSLSYAPIADFYKTYNQLQGNELAQSLSMAITALFAASNPRYLIQNTSLKSCLQYFEDFHFFLRRCMRTAEYQRLIAYPPEKSDTISQLLLYLTHSLCKSFFERSGGVKQEAIGLIHRTMRRGEEIKQKEKEHLLKGTTLWNQLLFDDENYRTLLSKFPNGPLFKILDLVREQEEDKTIYFDPIIQDNLPSKLYEIHRNGKTVDCLRIPSPTRQSVVNKVEIIDEFRGFLRSLAQDKRTMLIVNLQDRSSWKDSGRARAIESLQMSAEFSHQLFVLTLPKETDFYYQTNEYLNLNKADEFIQAFKDQLTSPEENGFCFPQKYKKGELKEFFDHVLPEIHERFFNGKNSLTRRNRENFIEIFYQFLVLKIMDDLRVNILSFICKDGIDVSAAEQGMFYGFIKLYSREFNGEKEKDTLRSLFYTPALFTRERAIDPERFIRAISVLEILEGEIYPT